MVVHGNSSDPRSDGHTVGSWVPVQVRWVTTTTAAHGRSPDFCPDGTDDDRGLTLGLRTPHRVGDVGCENVW